MRSCSGRIGVVALWVLCSGCGNTTSSPSPGSGGASSNGGLPGSGGVRGSGGALAGTVATGGHVGTGGRPGEGGMTPGSGGIIVAGGALGTGGIIVGGALGTGGAPSRGGSSGGRDGGIDSGGGAVGGNTGGTTATGGSQTIGTQTTGGTTGQGTGGVPSGGTRGSLATGGAGGASRTGGAASGGVSGSGGATTCGTQPTLKQAADCTGRLIGVALSTQHISETSYASAAKEFNYVTPENEMKWSSIQPSRGQFSFSGGDRIVSFASSNGMKVKGHALVWHNQLPSWVSSLGNAADVRAAMLTHIKTVVQYYKGKVHAWDVVNEAVSLDGKGMRDSVFYRFLGETFIDEAFQAAREADPDAKLYYNDYNCEGLTPKSNKVFELVKGMKSRNVAFDGVGLQMHYGEPNEATPTADFVANLQRYADLGLDLLISEMDVHVCAGLSPTQQQTLYHDLIAACVGQPRCIAVTFWGITDKYSWLNDEPDLGCSTGEKPLGLLWDDNFRKKPAYTGVMDALVGR